MTKWNMWAVLVVLWVVSGCSGNSVTDGPVPSVATIVGGSTVSVVSVTVAGTVPILSVGGTAQLTATARDASGNPVLATVIWTSSNPAVATVSSTGLITAVTPGTAVITASSGLVSSTGVNVVVSCDGLPSNTPTPMSVVPNPSSNLSINATISIAATIRDCNGNPVPDGIPVTFSLNSATLGSLSPTVSSVSGGSGVSTVSFTAGETAGAVSITATSGAISNSVSLTIQALPVLGITFNSAVPSVIGVKGAGQPEISEVSFSVEDTGGNPVADGQVVQFQFLDGFNPGGEAAVDPPQSATVGGVASTFIKSGFVAGPVRVLAFIDADDNTVFDSGEIYTTSTALSIGGGVPSMKFFSMVANTYNIAGLAVDGELVDMTVRIADRFGNYNILEGTSVSFYTEAGAIDRQGTTDTEGLTSVTLRSQDPRPVNTSPRQDLNPIGNELSLYNNANGNDYDSGELFEDLNGSGSQDLYEHFTDFDGAGYDLTEPNPRDGWDRVLAVTQGEETFYDGDGNGIYDAGEAFVDNGGEPFLDQNDNGLYDAKEEFVDVDASGTYTLGETFYDAGRGEPFFDTNGNGVRDSGEPFTDLNGDLIFDPAGEAWFDANSNDVFDVGEPFEDTNGNGVFDQGGFYDGVYNGAELYIDVDGNGQWTAGNGIWDPNTSIWKSLNVTFTGQPHVSPETTRLVIDDATSAHDPRSGLGSLYWITPGGCANFNLFVADVNNNAPISGTTVSLTVDGGKLIGDSSYVIPSIAAGPYGIFFGICDDDIDFLPESSTVTAKVTWTHSSVGTLTTALALGGTVDAPTTVAMTITTSSPLPSVSAACTACAAVVTFSAIGGAPAYTWSVVGGALPNNFSLNSATGVLTQTGSSTAGVHSFTVEVRDGLGTTVTKAFSITLS